VKASDTGGSRGRSLFVGFTDLELLDEEVELGAVAREGAVGLALPVQLLARLGRALQRLLKRSKAAVRRRVDVQFAVMFEPKDSMAGSYSTYQSKITPP
jgi:hypothetical protein